MSVMSVVQALSQVGNMAGVIDDKTAQKIDSRASLLETNGSITRLLSSTVVEPIIIVSESAYNSEKVEGAIKLSLDLFSSYYLQAFKILTQLQGLKSQEAIRVLSTKSGILNEMSNIPKQLQSLKSTANLLIQGHAKATEDVIKRLTQAGVFKEDYLGDLFDNNTDLFGNVIKVESFNVNIEKKSEKEDKNKFIPNDNLRIVGGGEKGIALDKFFIKELELTMNLETTSKNEKGEEVKEKKILIMPITVRSIVVKAGIESILSLCKPFNASKSFSSRWDDFKSGSIGLMNLLFCGDLINEYKKERLRTNSELNKLVNSRIGQSVTKLATQGARGFEANYNMMVLSTDDVNKINKYIRGDIFKDKYKEEILEQAHAIAATVLDDDYERMSLLIRDNYGVSTVSYRKISDKESDQYDAIIEMMHALSAGRNLQF